MTFLPIVERELRVAARQPSTMLFRFLTALVGIVIWLALITSRQGRNSLASAGDIVFEGLGILLFVCCFFAGIFLTADSLSSEKRERTLGLLFLTDLKGRDIVLGKLASTSLRAVSGLLAAFPLLALPLLMGGVTPEQLWHTILALLATLYLSLTCGLFFSAVTRRSRSGIGATFLFLFFVTAVLPLIFYVADVHNGPLWLQHMLLWPSPSRLLSEALDSPSAPEYWGSIAVIAALASAFLTGSAVVVPLTWRDRVEKENHRPRRKAQKPGDAAHGPFFWLARREQASPALVWSLLIVAIVASLTLACISAGSDRGQGAWKFIYGVLVAFAAHQLLKYVIASEAGRRFSEDRNSGAMELLLATPLTPDAMIRGQRAAMWRLCRGPLIALALLNLALFTCLLLSEWRSWSVMALGGVVLLATDYYALSWLGMWQGLRCRRHHRAIMLTLVQVMGPPWAGAFLMVFGVGFGTMSFDDMLACWFFIGLITSMMAGQLAESRIRADFRKFARNVFSEKRAPASWLPRLDRRPRSIGAASHEPA